MAAGRLSIVEVGSYWVAQFVGGIVGALILWGIVSGAPSYSRTKTELGTDRFESKSIVGLNASGAFAAEVVLTFLFVLVD